MDFDRFRELPAEEPEYFPEEEKGRSDRLLGALAVIVLILTVIVLSCYLVIYLAPRVSFNPFPPPTAIALLTPTPAKPTDTPLPTFPPTWTPTATPSHTPSPTITPTPSNTPLPTSTPRPTSTPKPPPPFYLDGEPLRMSQRLYPEANTAEWWLGFAGEVTDPNGAAILTVQIKVWDGEGWEDSQATGTRLDYRTQFGGGTSWWEQFVPSNCHLTKTYYLQVIQNGVGVSPVVKVEHDGNCSKNLIMVNFKRRY